MIFRNCPRSVGWKAKWQRIRTCPLRSAAFRRTAIV